MSLQTEVRARSQAIRMRRPEPAGMCRPALSRSGEKPVALPTSMNLGSAVIAKNEHVKALVSSGVLPFASGTPNRRTV